MSAGFARNAGDDALQALAEGPTRLAADFLDAQELGSGQVETAFQPIVDLQTQGVVAYEALTRGPRGTPLESPLALFAAMREAGQLQRFDRACRDAALARSIRGSLTPPLSVFVNVEPSLVEAEDAAGEDPTWEHAPSELRCVIEITERALTDRPAELLQSIAEIRDLSWGVALDDVGVDSRSLAFMGLLRPDVIKLDRSVVQAEPDRRIAEIASAVAAHSEETGAVVVAEGIENEAHALNAIALGASLGQGWWFGRPAPLPDPMPVAGSMVRFIPHGLDAGGPTPYALVSAHQDSRRGDTAVVGSLIDHLRHQAASQGAATVVLGLRLPDTAALAELAASAALVGLLVDEQDRSGLSDDLRVATLREDDPLRREMAFVVVSPHFAAAVSARRAGDAVDDEPAPVDFCVTYNREVVLECARTLTAHLPRR